MPKQEKRHNTHPEILRRAKALRSDQTPAEIKLWYILRNRYLNGYKFRRQHPIGKFIVDFYCVQFKLIIEVDGDSHADKEDYDRKRTLWLEKQGYRVIRFTDGDVHENLEGVAMVIIEACERDVLNR